MPGLFASVPIGNARAVRLRRGVFFDPDYNRKTADRAQNKKTSVLDSK
jgi:hypothetical protein